MAKIQVAKCDLTGVLDSEKAPVVTKEFSHAARGYTIDVSPKGAEKLDKILAARDEKYAAAAAEIDALEAEFNAKRDEIKARVKAESGMGDLLAVAVEVTGLPQGKSKGQGPKVSKTRQSELMSEFNRRVRVWARTQPNLPITINDRGRIPQTVVALYVRATGEMVPTF